MLWLTESAPAAIPTKLGDVDGDGLVNVYDLTRLRAHIRGAQAMPANLLPFADVNQDTFLNEDDAVAMIQMITGASPQKVLPLASVRETSPYAGEGTVALTREVIVRFSQPLSLNASLTTWDANTQTPGNFYAEGGGRKLLTRVELSGDRTKATLFFLEPVPASTRVTVTFDGTGVNDLLERPLDPEGDSAAGGTLKFTYDTAPITAVAGTGIIGHVYASERGAGGVNVPISGVLVRVVGSETLFTHTLADGSFSLNPCPAGRFFVEVDGRTSPASAFPTGAYYPYINKPWEALPGKADNLAAGTGTIYLPLIPAATLTPVSATQQTTITSTSPMLAGVEIYVPPNSLFSDDGTRGGKVGIAPVASDRLPEPLPPGLNHALDISIQTDGGTNFDRPVPVKFPNLPDPVTGVKLKPGEKSALWSYNHDKGGWEIVGPMTVTDDGEFVVTDVGVGVRQPGWHGTNPGFAFRPESPRICNLRASAGLNRSARLASQGPACGNDACNNPPPIGQGGIWDWIFHEQLTCVVRKVCENQSNSNLQGFPKWSVDWMSQRGWQSMIDTASLGYPANTLADATFPDIIAAQILGDYHFKHELSPLFHEYARKLVKEDDWRDRFTEWDNQHEDFLENVVTPCFHEVIGFGGLPFEASIAAYSVKSDARELRKKAKNDAVRQLRPKEIFDPLNGMGQKMPKVHGAQDIYPEVPEGKLGFSLPLGNRLIVGQPAQVKVFKRGVGGAVSEVSTATGAVRFEIISKKSDAVIDQTGKLSSQKATQPLHAISDAVTLMVSYEGDVTFARVYIDDKDENGDGVNDSFQVSSIGLSHGDILRDIDGDGLLTRDELLFGTNPKEADSDGDGFNDETEVRLALNPLRAPITSQYITYEGPLYYALIDLETGLIYRGSLLSSKLDLDQVGGEDRRFECHYAIPNLELYGYVVFKSPKGGGRLSIPSPLLGTALGISERGAPIGRDGDGDGISDTVEFVLGTDPRVADTDGDGVSDFAEVQEGSDPLDNRPVQTGVLNALDTPGYAKDIAAQNGVAIVADGSEGVSVFYVANALNPVRTAQVRLDGSTEAVALDGTRAAAVGSSLALLDLSDLSAVRVTKQLFLGSTPRAVVAAGGVAYVGLANGQVVAADMAAGAELERLQVSPEPIHDLSFSGDVLYARTSGHVYAVEFAPAGMTVSGSATVLGSSIIRLRIFAGGGLAYAPSEQGYTILSLADPLHPVVTQTITTEQRGWRHLVPTGSGLGVAAMSVNPDGNADVHLYDLNPNGTGSQFLTTFTTPGDSQAVSIYNGLAYVADGDAGLTVVNYKAYDALGVPPTISISTGFSTVGGSLQAEEGKLGRVTATVTDDVQVRNVEFYVDGVRVVTDGNFPFEHRFTTPLQSAAATAAVQSAQRAARRAAAGETSCCGGVAAASTAPAIAAAPIVAAAAPLKTSFTLRAKATDTGGNSTWSDEITVNLVADATGPRVVKILPPNGAFTGSLRTVSAVFSEPLNPATLDATSFAFVAAGPDALFGTADDITPANGTLSYRESNNSAFLTFPADLAPGRYQLTIRPPLADLAGNPLAAPVTANLRVFSFADADGDGIPDEVEPILGLNPNNPDTDGDGIRDGTEDFDGDGLNNAGEIFLALDPTNPDTNANGIPDGQEDPDNDKLNNAREALAGTDANNPDTDGDGWNDETEVTGGSNPLDSRSKPNGFFTSLPVVNSLRIQNGAGTLPRGVYLGSPQVNLTRIGAFTGFLSPGVIIATPQVDIMIPSP